MMAKNKIPLGCRRILYIYFYLPALSCSANDHKHSDSTIWIRSFSISTDWSSVRE